MFSALIQCISRDKSLLGRGEYPPISVGSCHKCREKMGVYRGARISSLWLLPYMLSKDFGSLANIHFRAFTANDAVNEVRTRAGEGICEMEELMCGGRNDIMIGEELRTGAIYCPCKFEPHELEA